MKNIKSWESFNESINEGLSSLQVEYRKYFKDVLSCYDVESPSKLSEKKKKEFFDNIKKYWTKGKGMTKDITEIKKEICGLDENVSDYSQEMPIVKGEIGKIKKGVDGGAIDLGIVGKVSDVFIKNIKKTYPNSIISVVNDRYILKII